MSLHPFQPSKSASISPILMVVVMALQCVLCRFNVFSSLYALCNFLLQQQLKLLSMHAMARICNKYRKNPVEKCKCRASGGSWEAQSEPKTIGYAVGGCDGESDREKKVFISNWEKWL